MAVLKCKMCGGDLVITEGSSVCKCEYCGTPQTVPCLDNEKKANLFARANRLRFGCEFDKAYSVYESIAEEFTTEAEAYWGLVLCKYGIEYVDDPKTGKKIPTCHRSSFESIFDDSNFELTLENADAVARTLYREEAKAIEEIRKSIIEVSSKEEPYDIFICYKETDEKNNRTIDSVIAQDVYEALTEKGYRVFFSRISLEDKLGKEYEPYIFSALHSAKIMLVFGTDYEYFNAVWVKNEWSRFLKLMEQDSQKTLIPCYKGIDAYDMPREFARLQAQDMGKVGAIQDLLRGIGKILNEKTVKDEVIVKTVVNEGSLSSFSAPLIQRGNDFLQEKEFRKAQEFYEKALDYEPQNENALLGVFLTSMNASSLDELGRGAALFDGNKNYHRLIKYCSSETIAKIEAQKKNILETISVLGKSCLEAGQFKSAKNHFDTVLKYDAKNEDALLGIFLASLEVSSLESLGKKTTLFEENSAYHTLTQACSEETRIKIDKQKTKILENQLASANSLFLHGNYGQSKSAYESYVNTVKDLNERILPLSVDKAKAEISKCEIKIQEEKAIKEKQKKAKRRRVVAIFSACACIVIAVAICIALYMKNISDNEKLYGVEKTDSGYKIVNGNAYSVDENGHIALPSEVNGLPVITVSARAFNNRNDIKSVTIPEGIEYIGNMAFNYCKALTSVTFGSDVISIGDSAFYGCASLTNITFKSALQEIKSYAFGNCDSLKNISIPNSVTSIGGYAFTNCNELTNIFIPNSVTFVGSGAFHNCPKLTIYAEARSKPAKWSYNWKPSECVVAWDSADGGTLENGLKWTAKNNEATVIGYSGNDTELTIPAQIKGYSVKVIESNVFKSNHTLQTVTIPDSVTTVGNSAFENCTALKAVHIGNGVTTIGERAFWDCSALESIQIPISVNSVGANAFYNCSSLSIYAQASSKPNGWDKKWNSSSCTVAWDTYDSGITEAGLLWVSDGAEVSILSYVGTDASLVIPTEINGYSVTSIKTGAFIECESLKTVTIPKSVVTISNNAFDNCPDLIIFTEEKSKPQGWDEEWNPSGCSVAWGAHGILQSGIIWDVENGEACITNFVGAATELHIPQKIENYPVTKIRAGAFKNHDRLLILKIPQSITTIEDEAFYNCIALQIIILEDGLKSIGNNAFYNCYNLENVAIPNSVTSLGKSAFYGCSSLKSITLSKNLTSVPEMAFYQCKSLTSVFVGHSIQAIEKNSFYSCESLSKVTLGDGVISIGEYAFYNCPRLKDVTFGNNVEIIDSYAFYGTALNSITIPESVTSIGIYAFSYCTALNSITIPESVTSIGIYAFSYCTALNSITIPESVTSIGIYAFSYCTALNSVKINANIKAISDYTFYNCEALTSVELSSSITAIGSYAFAYCDSLAEITIPDHTALINSYAFAFCNSLTRIVIPDSVISIGSYAFSYCSNLEKIFVPKKITTINSNTFYSCSKLTIYTDAESKPSGWNYNWHQASITVTWGRNLESFE